jgi:hypothetical protein
VTRVRAPEPATCAEAEELKSAAASAARLPPRMRGTRLAWGLGSRDARPELSLSYTAPFGPVRPRYGPPCF